MSRIPFVRRLAALTIVLALTLPWTTAAAPHAPGRPAAAESSLARRLWSWLTSLWGDNGCGLDPWGGCIPGTGTAPAPSTDNGCGLDPDGRCGG